MLQNEIQHIPILVKLYTLELLMYYLVVIMVLIH